jgi:hypothetical protein
VARARSFARESGFWGALIFGNVPILLRGATHLATQADLRVIRSHENNFCARRPFTVEAARPLLSQNVLLRIVPRRSR